MTDPPGTKRDDHPEIDRAAGPRAISHDVSQFFEGRRHIEGR